MTEPHFIDSSDVSPFAIDDYKSGPDPESQRLSRYYEWNDKNQQWAKLNEHDPTPPADLKPGRFDGQIVEVPH